MNQYKLPHYSRLFSANLISTFIWICVWTAFFFIITYNILLRFRKNTLDPFRLAVINHPESVVSHQNLARLYFINGYTGDAKREMALIPKTKIQPGQAPEKNYANVLGETAPKSDLLSEWQQESLKQLSIYMYWKSVAADKPDYISAKLNAAASAAILGKIDETRELLKQVKEADPTNKDVIRLTADIEKK
jgi:hypothetical protein